MFSPQVAPNWQLYRVITADDTDGDPFLTDENQGANMAGFRWLLVLAVGINTDTPPPNAVAWPEASVAVDSGPTPNIQVNTWVDALGAFVPTGVKATAQGVLSTEVLGQKVSITSSGSTIASGKAIAIFVAGYNSPDRN